MLFRSKQINPRLRVHIVATDPDLINLLQLANDPNLNNPYRSSAYATLESALQVVAAGAA